MTVPWRVEPVEQRRMGVSRVERARVIRRAKLDAPRANKPTRCRHLPLGLEHNAGIERWVRVGFQGTPIACAQQNAAERYRLGIGNMRAAGTDLFGRRLLMFSLGTLSVLNELLPGTVRTNKSMVFWSVGTVGWA